MPRRDPSQDESAPQAPQPGRLPRPLWARVLLAPLDLLVALIVLLDALIGPVLRPILRLVARLKLVAALERGVAALPPYGILVALAVPFALAEPLKLVALVWLAQGRVVTGVAAMVVAYVVSLVLVERMYQAGRAKLMTIGWFARVMGWLIAVRDTVMNRLRATATWRLAHEAAAAARRRGTMVVQAVRRALGWERQGTDAPESLPPSLPGEGNQQSRPLPRRSLSSEALRKSLSREGEGQG